MKNQQGQDSEPERRIRTQTKDSIRFSGHVQRLAVTNRNGQKVSMLEFFKPKHSYFRNIHNHKRKTVLNFKPDSSEVIARYNPIMDSIQVWINARRDKKKRSEDFSVERNDKSKKPVPCHIYRQDWEVNSFTFLLVSHIFL